VAAGADAAGRYPGVAVHLQACARAVRTSRDSSRRFSMANATGGPGGAVTGREVLAFDLYGTMVDPIAISDELSMVLGDTDGRAAASLWRVKQLEYSFRLTAMGLYEDFRWVTARALDFALSSLGASLPSGQTERLIELYDHLRPFPDAVPALQALTGMGYELAVFSNGTPAMIANCLDNSGLGEFFGCRISVDDVRVFKPSPVAYQHAAARLSLPHGRITLVTSNTFDSVGASAAGLRTAWVNRSAAPFDTIGMQPSITVSALDRLPAALAG
jgi:2-haloacid dehalogenase